MKLQEKFKISSFVLTDPCYGSCDIADADAERLGAEVAFNIGHSISMKKIGTRTFMINAFDDVSFEEVLEEAVKTLKPHKKIGISTSSQHIHKLDQIVDYFNNNGIEADVGTGKGQLKDGQVFGCEEESITKWKRGDCYTFESIDSHWSANTGTKDKYTIVISVLKDLI